MFQCSSSKNVCIFLKVQDWYFWNWLPNPVGKIFIANFSAYTFEEERVKKMDHKDLKNSVFDIKMEILTDLFVIVTLPNGKTYLFLRSIHTYFSYHVLTQSHIFD